MILTGTHNPDAKGSARRRAPAEGCDVRIGKEVWIAAGAVILGPCTIGDYCVVAAGAMVRPGTYPPGVLLGGLPARVIRSLQLE